MHANKKKNALLFVLIDSEVSNLEASSKLAKDVEKIGASAILVGGSSATDQIEMAQVVKGIKKDLKMPHRSLLAVRVRYYKLLSE